MPMVLGSKEQVRKERGDDREALISESRNIGPQYKKSYPAVPPVVNRLE